MDKADTKNENFKLWGDKRYNNLSQFFKNKFGQKIFKVSINGGFSCPNRDGSIGTKGCIFCSEEGSGEFAGSINLNIGEQFKEIKEKLSKKWSNAKYIAHFQSFTNTYAPVNILRDKYYQAMEEDNVVGLAIATRPDCIGDDVLELLGEINKKTYLFVELGLQTINEDTAKLINRGYDLECFKNSVERLRNKNIDVVVHLILGLPNETKQDILNSIKFISIMDIQGVKLHLLYIVEGTSIEELYQKGEFKLLEMQEYVDLICDCIENLREDIVIHRLTGDGKKETLVGPKWSLDKMRVLSEIDRELKNRNTYQGKLKS
jgi:radical SAM protein (TIGR01212 family)